MEEKKFVVYCHTNKINGKKYVGITCQQPHRRYGKDGSHYTMCPRFYNAIQKYGWDNFEHLILQEDLTEDEACQMEIKLIKEWKTQNPKYGYNIDGGGINNSLVGHPVSEETKNKISSSRKGKYAGENSSWYGRNHSEESKRKISESRKGKYCGENAPSSRKVICLNTRQIFVSATDAQKKLGIKGNNIIACCRKKYHYAGVDPNNGGRLRWMYYEEYIQCDEDMIKVELSKVNDNASYRKVYCIELNMVFNTAAEGDRYANQSKGRVSKCCRGQRKSAGRHPITKEPLHWMYYEDYIAMQNSDNNINSNRKEGTVIDK